MRTCVGCRTRRAQAELVRVAVGANGRIVESRTAPGRGAWLCDPPGDCLATALRRHAFDRALRRKVDPEAVSGLFIQTDQSGLDAVPAADAPTRNEE